MSDLITWLLDQLDDDEQVARAASPGPWSPNAESDEVLAIDGERVADGFALSGRQLRATVEHIARHDPARVLAEVDAKRRILDLVASTELDPHDESDRAHRTDLDAVLRLLALPYADREGFRPEWAPTSAPA